MKKLVIIFISLNVIVLSGCEKKSKLEQAREKLEDAGKDAREGLEDAAKEVEEETEDAADKVEEKAEDAEDESKGEVKKSRKKLKNLFK